MSRITAALQHFAQSYGFPGLFLIAFLDSSFLSLPQVNDLLIIWMVIEFPSRWMLYAGAATAGSVAGCLVMYGLARKGGEALLRKGMSERRVEWGMAQFQRWGLMAVLVPAILPPPAPFKIFILLAGVTKVPLGQFIAAVTIGRGFRYFGQALLARWYGQQALTFLEVHARPVSLALAGALVAGVVVYLLVRRRRSASVSAAI
jgi:membrane protein YqaA with SNARE-associated domain